MKERTVVISFETRTTLPVETIRRDAQVWLPYGNQQHLEQVNKPRVEVIQKGKARGKR